MRFWVQMRSMDENELLPFSDRYIMLKGTYKILDQYTKPFSRYLHFSNIPIEPKICVFNTLNITHSSGA